MGTFGCNRECNLHSQRHDPHTCSSRPPSLGRHMQFWTFRLRLHVSVAADDQRLLHAALRKSSSRACPRNLQFFRSSATDNIIEIRGGCGYLDSSLDHDRFCVYLANDFLQSNSMLLFDIRRLSHHRIGRIECFKEVGADERDECVKEYRAII